MKKQHKKISTREDLNLISNSKGITLVALIITIIVMLILVGVSITIAIKGGLFDTTKRAAKGTEKAKNAEQELSSGRVKIDGIWYDSLEDYAIGVQSAIQGVEDLDESNTTFTYNPTTWTNGEVKVTISTTVLTSGYTLQYSTDGINWTEYIAGTEIPVGIDGEIYAKMVDSDGNEGGSVSGKAAKIDKEGPTINIQLNSTGAVENTIPLSINVTDGNSGISKIEWYYKESTASDYTTITDEYTTMNGTTAGDKTAVTKETTLSNLKSATYNIYAIVYDVAGNSTKSPETGTINVTAKVLLYEDAPKDVNGVLTTNVKYISDGKIATIPKGFKIVDGIEGTKSIADGLVIQDKDGNEFVWIPVEITESDTEMSIASFYRSEWANNARTIGLSTTYTEPYSSGYTTPEGKTEAEEYAEMVKSVYKNKGFYIGRYEVGSTTERTDKANGTTTMVVKKNQYPYNYVGWGASMNDYTSDVVYNSKNQGKGAVYLSKKLYEEKDVGVTSTLCYGVQWDAMLDFIKDQKDVTSSSSWGNYKPATGSGTLKNTGSSGTYAAKNIYDVAGNLLESTMEANNGTKRLCRGGSYKTLATNTPAVQRNANPGVNECYINLGFRITLYIK